MAGPVFGTPVEHLEVGLLVADLLRRVLSGRRGIHSVTTVEFLDRSYYGNEIRDYLVAAGITVAVLVAAYLGRLILVRKLGALAALTKTRVDDLVVHVLERTRMWVVLIVAVYLGTLPLELPPSLQRTMEVMAGIAGFLQVGVWTSGVIRFLVADHRKRKEIDGDTSALGTLVVLSVVAQMVLWAIVLLLILDNVGVNVTALVAGLGIGGIAVALALQNILTDLFASVSIMLDKPFEVGDLITVGAEAGHVQSIGVKTTRVRSLSGEELVFANGDLLQARIRNFKRMQERRILFSIGVTYQTSADTVERLPALLQSIVEGVEGVRFDRAHFKEFGDSALIFEVVYFVEVPEYRAYMDVQQRINLAIVRAFETDQIEIAYPTRTLYLHQPT